MKTKTKFSLACLIAMAAMAPATLARAQSTALAAGPLTGEATGVKSLTTEGGAIGPSPNGSNINNYINQDEQLNLLPESGTVKVLRTDQKALVNDFVTAIFPISKVNPRELRGVLRAVIGLEGGDVEVIYNPGDGPDSIEVVCPKYLLPYLEQAIPLLDEAWVREYDTGSADVYYKAKHRNAASIDFIASQYGSDNGFSELDVTANAVNRIDEPYRIDNYLKGAAAVDIPANQVHLEVKIYEVASINDLKLGLDYISWKNGPGRGLVRFVLTGADAQSNNETFSSVFDPFAAISGITDENFKLLTDFDQYYRAVNYLLPSNYIDFLQNKGQARLINSQELMVKSANTASLEAESEIVALVSSSPGSPGSAGIGDNISGSRILAMEVDLDGDGIFGEPGEFQVQVVPSDVRDSNRTLNRSTAGQIGVFLTITPFVGLCSMELVIDTTVNDLNGLTPDGQPIINSRSVHTTVRLLDGEPYVIAGLTRRYDIKQSDKAPGLGDIPVFGYLFGGETDIKRNDDIVITVTPHFYVSAQTEISLPRRVETLAKKVAGTRAAYIPNNPYGYDQWLLDPNK